MTTPAAPSSPLRLARTGCGVDATGSITRARVTSMLGKNCTSPCFLALSKALATRTNLGARLQVSDGDCKQMRADTLAHRLAVLGRYLGLVHGKILSLVEHAIDHFQIRVHFCDD